MSPLNPDVIANKPIPLFSSLQNSGAGMINTVSDLKFAPNKYVSRMSRLFHHVAIDNVNAKLNVRC